MMTTDPFFTKQTGESSSDSQVSKPGTVAAITLAIFALAVVSRDVVFSFAPYHEAYQHLPEFPRYCEQPLRWTLLCLLGLYIAHRMGPFQSLGELGLRSPAGPAVVFAFTACLPMLIGPALTGRINPDLTFQGVLFGAGIWPLAEEILYRGYAFRQLYHRANWPFWIAALGVGFVFGLVHLGQSSVRQLPLSGEIGVVAIVGIGGLLYAWLFVKWNDNLWVPFAVHGFMNLWWEVFDMAESPLGGWFPNALRLLTVCLAMVFTIYRHRIPYWRTQPETFV